MAATDLEKMQSLYNRSRTTSLAGVNLANEVETLLQFDNLSADELRIALRQALENYRMHCEEARQKYRQRGIALGEILPSRY